MNMNLNTHTDLEGRILSLVEAELARVAPEHAGCIDALDVAHEVATSHSLEIMAQAMARRLIAQRRGADGHAWHAGNDGTVKVVNLTPHTVTLYSRDGTTVVGEIPMSGLVARVNTNVSIDFPVTLELEGGGLIEDVPLLYQERDVTSGLPAPREGIYYIVSSLVLDTFPDREDLITMNTSNDRLGAIKDERGYTIGTRSLRPASTGIFRDFL